jgi:hypothetical protein
MFLPFSQRYSISENKFKPQNLDYMGKTKHKNCSLSAVSIIFNLQTKRYNSIENILIMNRGLKL